jgi:hypothetical protein
MTIDTNQHRTNESHTQKIQITGIQQNVINDILAIPVVGDEQPKVLIGGNHFVNNNPTQSIDRQVTQR